MADNQPIEHNLDDIYRRNGEVNIHDIARALNVSKSTVSRALQDHYSIGKATKEKVKQLAEKYHYQPNAIAASLFKKSTKTIGVIVPILSHYFFSTVIAGIEEVAYHAGYKVIICQSNELYEREVTVSKTLLSAKVDGLIASVAKQTTDMQHFQTFIDKNIPTVFFDRLPLGVNANTVSVDDYQGAFNIVEHLIQQGCKQIMHLSGPMSIALSQNRVNGYKAALQKYGLPVDEALIYECGFKREDGIRAVENMLASGLRPDAIFAVCDPVAIGAMLTLKKNGISLPKQMAVAGFNDDPTATIVEPALTTVQQPAFEIGATACRIFLQQIAQPDTPVTKQVLKTNLVVRASSAIAKV